MSLMLFCYPTAPPHVPLPSASPAPLPQVLTDENENTTHDDLEDSEEPESFHDEHDESKKLVKSNNRSVWRTHRIPLFMLGQLKLKSYLEVTGTEHPIHYFPITDRIQTAFISTLLTPNGVGSPRKNKRRSSTGDLREAYDSELRSRVAANGRVSTSLKMRWACRGYMQLVMIRGHVN